MLTQTQHMAAMGLPPACQRPAVFCPRDILSLAHLPTKIITPSVNRRPPTVTHATIRRRPPCPCRRRVARPSLAPTWARRLRFCRRSSGLHRGEVRVRRRGGRARARLVCSGNQGVAFLLRQQQTRVRASGSLTWTPRPSGRSPPRLQWSGTRSPSLLSATHTARRGVNVAVFSLLRGLITGSRSAFVGPLLVHRRWPRKGREKRDESQPRRVEREQRGGGFAPETRLPHSDHN